MIAQRDNMISCVRVWLQAVPRVELKAARPIRLQDVQELVLNVLIQGQAVKWAFVAVSSACLEPWCALMWSQRACQWQWANGASLVYMLLHFNSLRHCIYTIARTVLDLACIHTVLHRRNAIPGHALCWATSTASHFFHACLRAEQAAHREGGAGAGKWSHRGGAGEEAGVQTFLFPPSYQGRLAAAGRSNCGVGLSLCKKMLLLRLRHGHDTISGLPVGLLSPLAYRLHCYVLSEIAVYGLVPTCLLFL